MAPNYDVVAWGPERTHQTNCWPWFAAPTACLHCYRATTADQRLECSPGQCSAIYCSEMCQEANKHIHDHVCGKNTTFDDPRTRRDGKVKVLCLPTDADSPMSNLTKTTVDDSGIITFHLKHNAVTKLNIAVKREVAERKPPEMIRTIKANRKLAVSMKLSDDAGKKIEEARAMYASAKKLENKAKRMYASSKKLQDESRCEVELLSGTKLPRHEHPATAWEPSKGTTRKVLTDNPRIGTDQRGFTTPNSGTTRYRPGMVETGSWIQFGAAPRSQIYIAAADELSFRAQFTNATAAEAVEAKSDMDVEASSRSQEAACPSGTIPAASKDDTVQPLIPGQGFFRLLSGDGSCANRGRFMVIFPRLNRCVLVVHLLPVDQDFSALPYGPEREAFEPNLVLSALLGLPGQSALIHGPVFFFAMSCKDDIPVAPTDVTMSDYHAIIAGLRASVGAPCSPEMYGEKATLHAVKFNDNVTIDRLYDLYRKKIIIPPIEPVCTFASIPASHDHLTLRQALPIARAFEVGLKWYIRPAFCTPYMLRPATLSSVCGSSIFDPNNSSISELHDDVGWMMRYLHVQTRPSPTGRGKQIAITRRQQPVKGSMLIFHASGARIDPGQVMVLNAWVCISLGGDMPTDEKTCRLMMKQRVGWGEVLAGLEPEGVFVDPYSTQEEMRGVEELVYPGKHAWNAKRLMTELAVYRAKGGRVTDEGEEEIVWV